MHFRLSLSICSPVKSFFSPLAYTYLCSLVDTLDCILTRLICSQWHKAPFRYGILICVNEVVGVAWYASLCAAVRAVHMDFYAFLLMDLIRSFFLVFFSIVTCAISGFYGKRLFAAIWKEYKTKCLCKLLCIHNTHTHTLIWKREHATMHIANAHTHTFDLLTHPYGTNHYTETRFCHF